MTSVHAAPSLADEVAGLLVDRVPARVLDRVLLELLETDRDESDDDLRMLLEQGCLAGSLRTQRGRAAHLVGVRTEQPARLVSRVRMHADAYRVELSVCSLGATVWILLPAGLRSSVASLLEQPGLPKLLALGRDVTDLRLAAAYRASLDELLDVGQRRGWQGVAETTKLEAALRIDALLDLTARQPELLEGPLDALFDVEANQVLADTLFQWFAYDRDAAATATAMHLHVNTVRYRLRRVQEMTGIDLDDWDQRLLAELQLRLWRGVEHSRDNDERQSGRRPSQISAGTYGEGGTG